MAPRVKRSILQYQFELKIIFRRIKPDATPVNMFTF